MVDRHGNLLYQVVCSWDFDHIILLVLLEQIENSICIILECLAWPGGGQWQLDESQNIFCIECLCYLGLGLNCYLFIIVSLSLLYLLSVWRAEAEEVSNLLSGKLLTISICSFQQQKAWNPTVVAGYPHWGGLNGGAEPFWLLLMGEVHW